MFEYTMPTAAQQSCSMKKQAKYDRMVKRAMSKVMKVERMSMKALKAELVKEWIRTESERAAAPTCPGSSQRIIMDGETYHVYERYIVHDGFKDSGEYYAHYATCAVPLRHWWDYVIQPEKAWGQWSKWERFDAWAAIQRNRRRQQEQGEAYG